MALKVIILEKFGEGGNTKLAEVKQNVFGKNNWVGSGTLTPKRALSLSQCLTMTKCARTCPIK